MQRKKRIIQDQLLSINQFISLENIYFVNNIRKDIYFESYFSLTIVQLFSTKSRTLCEQLRASDRP